MSTKNLLQKQKNKFIAGLLCILIVSGILITALSGSFALATPVSFAADPINFVAEKVSLLTVGGSSDSFRVSNVGDYFATSDSVTVTCEGTNTILVKPEKAGRVSVLYCTKTTGKIMKMEYWVKDFNNIIEYTLTNGNHQSIAKGATDKSVIITAKDGKGNDAINKISWVSMNPDIADVNASGKILAKNEDGNAVLIGTFTDIWGRSQFIAYMVTVGNPNGGTKLGDGVVQIGEDYYKPVTDAPGVWEKTDPSGEESSGIYVGGNESLPNPFDPVYKIKPEDNEQNPPASDYSDKYEGYLTTKPDGSSEYDQWQKAMEAVVDKSALQEAIDAADKLNKGNYNSGLWDYMQDKLAEAKRVNNDPDATQEEVNEATEALRSALNALGVFTVGSEIKMGKDSKGYELEWQILDIDVKNGKALVITTTVAAECLFHPTTPYPTWKNSNMRKYLQENFYVNYFSAADKEKILLSDITTKVSYKTNDSTIETTKDYLFLLSESELSAYWPKAADRIPKTTNMGNRTGSSSNATSWGYNRYWLRSPKGDANSAGFIDNLGTISYYTVIYGKNLPDTDRSQGGVRPAMWVDLSKF